MTLDLDGSFQGAVEEPFRGKRPRQPERDAAGDRTSHELIRPFHDRRGRSGSLDLLDVGHLAGGQRLIEPRLFQACREVAVVGFLQFLAPLQLENRGFDGVEAAGFLSHLGELVAQQFDARFQGRDLRRGTLLVGARDAGGVGRRRQRRLGGEQLRVFEFEFLFQRVGRGNLVANIGNQRAFLGELQLQFLLPAP